MPAHYTPAEVKSHMEEFFNFVTPNTALWNQIKAGVESLPIETTPEQEPAVIPAAETITE